MTVLFEGTFHQLHDPVEVPRFIIPILHYPNVTDMNRKAFFLLAGCMWLMMACRTGKTLQGVSEYRTNRETTLAKTSSDQEEERRVDSVFVLVNKTDSSMQMVKETTHWREKTRVIKDTVVIHMAADTLYKKVKEAEENTRSPPYGTPSLVLLILLSAVIVAAKLFTSKNKVL